MSEISEKVSFFNNFDKKEYQLIPQDNDLSPYKYAAQYKYYITCHSCNCNHNNCFDDETSILIYNNKDKNKTYTKQKMKSHVVIENLVSIYSGHAPYQDFNLVNPWGTIVVGDEIWVVCNSTHVVTKYDQNGVKLPTAVKVRDSPTGIVHNTTNHFVISKKGLHLPALWLVCTEKGTIYAYNPLLNPSESMLVIDNSTLNAKYTGITMLENHIYVTDFYNGKIDVFNEHFKQIFTFPFADNDIKHPIPNTYSPFNIKNIKGSLYVTYALITSISTQDQKTNTINSGFINIFNSKGVFVKRFVSYQDLNSPYDIIDVKDFLDIPNSLLVSNYGDSSINVYNRHGLLMAKLKIPTKKFKINRNNIRGLVAVNNTIYFATANGLLGKITSSLPSLYHFSITHTHDHTHDQEFKKKLKHKSAQFNTLQDLYS